MQFSDTTSKLGILQACERFCNMGDAGITSSSTFLKEFTAHVNSVLRRLWHPIFMAYGGWQYDDTNQTDLPAGTITLTSGQTSYPIPSGSLTIRGVEVKDTGGVWSQLKPLTEEQIRDRQAMGEFYKTSGKPRFYEPIGDSFRIYPPSDYTQSASLKVFFDRGSVAFESTDTTKSAGFASEYHDILPIGASLEYLKIKTPTDPTTAYLRQEYADLENRLKEYYSKRFKQLFPPRVTVKDQMNENT